MTEKKVLRARKIESTHLIRPKIADTYCEIAKALQDIEIAPSITPKLHSALETAFQKHIEVLEELQRKFLELEWKEVTLKKRIKPAENKKIQLKLGGKNIQLKM